MSIAVIVEKPSVAQALLPLLRGQHPDQALWFPCLLRGGFFHPPLPRGKRWADYPCIEPIDDLSAYVSTAGIKMPRDLMLLKAEPHGERVHPAAEDAYERVIREAEVLYLAPDPGPSACWAAEVLRRRNRSPDAPWQAWFMTAMDAPSLERGWARASTDHARARIDAMAREGEVRAYFDHQFALNSVSILGHTARLAGSPVASPWVSKYQIQTLYALRQGPGPTWGHLLHRMQAWPGTGAYRTEYPHPLGLGSASSRHLIVEQLMAHGWVAQRTQTKRFKGIGPNAGPRPVTTLELTETGAELLDRWLHPRCEDADLPYRLETWAQAGLAASQPSIDRYLRTWFGRQKRWLDQGPPESEG